MIKNDTILLPQEQPPKDPVALVEFLSRTITLLNGSLAEVERRLQELEDDTNI